MSECRVEANDRITNMTGAGFPLIGKCRYSLITCHL